MEILDFLKEIGIGLITLLVIAAPTERGFQVIKQLVNAFLRLLKIETAIYDEKTFFFVAVLSWLLVSFTGIDVTAFLSQFDWYNAELAQLVNALLVMLTTNLIHSKYFPGASR